MLQINVWKIGPYWKVQVFDSQLCCDCEPDYYFNEQADNEFDLHKLMKQAVKKFNEVER